jgi:hypothetical protein
LGAPTSENAVTIEGDVYDQEASVPIPSARVVLTYRGNTIADTVTDVRGHFVVSNLHGRRECGQYRLVVSSERDNPSTPAVERFGYRAFDSGIFSPVDFSAMVTDGGRINLSPRVGDMDTGGSVSGLLPGETQVLVTWSSPLSVISVGTGTYVRSILPHLVVPASRGFVKQGTYFGGRYSDKQQEISGSIEAFDGGDNGELAYYAAEEAGGPENCTNLAATPAQH